jgi:RecB family endonuclease NucS
LFVIDKENKSRVIIEIKRNKTSADTLGQIALYMNYVRENFNNDNVHGIVIAGEYDNRIKHTLKVISHVEVFRYKINVKLAPFK